MTQDPTDKLSNDCKFEIRAQYGECTTRVPVDQAPAGPALDAAVVRMQWSEKFSSLSIDFKYMLFASSEERLQESLDSSWIGTDNIMMGEAESFCLKLPKYSTDIAAAWELWQDAKENCWADFIDKLEWDADTSSVFDVLRYVAPDTITRAYLKTKGVEWIEIPD